MANTTDYSRLLDGYALLAIKEYIKNNYLQLSGGTLTGNLIFKKNGNTIPNISFQGTKATYAMIKFLDNTGDTYGNGISIGGGGAVVIGAGESADAIVSGAGVAGGTETLYLGSDGNIYLLTNVQNGYANAKTFTFADSGNLTVPGSITEAGTTLANKYAAKSHTHTKSQITDFPTSMPASDVYAWAKAATKPSYTYSEVGAAAAHHLYHTWDNNTNYYDSYEGGNMFRIITENMYADIFRFQASTVANLEYHNGSAWVAWSFDLSNLFDGNARTGISIPYANRKFRFTMRTNGGWPTTGMFMLQGTWFNDGGWPDGQKSDIIIETRANESASWTQRATFTLSGVEGMAGHTLSALHTGETYYRITITIYPWTNTSNSCPLQRLCLFSNYNGGALEKITHDGYGNVTIPTLKSTTIYENGTTLANKYLGKTAKAADADKLDGQDSTYYLNYNNLTNKPTIPSGSSLWNSGSTTWNVSNNVTCAGTGEWSFDCNGDTASNMWHVWSSKNSKTILACYPYDNRVEVPNGNFLVSGTISEGGTTLANKYLGKTAKAADADKLDGHDSSYFINTSNIGSQYVYHSDTSDWATDADNSNKLNGNGPAYYLNYNNFTNTPSCVLYTSQTLTDAQKTQARSNIGAGTSSFTGYTSSNKLHTDYINNAAGWTSVTESTVSGWGFTKNAGTVTSVKVGSTSYSPSSGVVSLPAYPTKASWNYDDVYVKLTGNQSISGIKTFTGKIEISDGQNSYRFVPGQEGDLALELVNESSQTTTVYLMNPNTPNIAQYIALRSWVSDNYLGKTAKAADADKLDGNDSSYFINTSNIGSQSVYHSEVSDYATDAGTASNSTSLGGNGPAYYLNYNNFTNKPSAVLYTSQSLTDAQKTQARSNIGAGTSSLAIGTTASTAAAGNHTHTLSIASGGTSSINLQANTTYTLTAGGKTYAFKTPPAGGSGYYSNQYNETYYLSSNSGASLWSEDIQAGMAVIGLGGGNATVIGIGWPGLASGSFKRSLLFTGNRVDLTLTDRDQNYLKGLSIDMYDDDYYTLHIRANEYSDLYGSVDTENYAHVNLHAYSFVYTPYSTNSAVSYRKYVDLGVVMHNINYTYSSTVLLKMNIRGTGANDGAITSYAGLCSLLYYAGHRSAATCLTCSGRYSSSSQVVLGVYATAYNSGLYLVYCSASSNTVNTLSIPNGTVTDTLSASLVP